MDIIMRLKNDLVNNDHNDNHFQKLFSKLWVIQGVASHFPVSTALHTTQNLFCFH